MTRIVKLDRRGFLGAGAGAAFVGASGLTLGFAPEARAAEPAQITPFLAIDEDGAITLLNPFAEMGQGIYSGLAQVIADELGCELERIASVHAPPGEAYRLLFGGQMRFTGGSYSMRSAFEPIRKAGATARAMLIRAAAERWKVAAGALDAVGGEVVGGPDGATVGFGAIVAAASALEPPADPPLREKPSLIGARAPRIDTPPKTNGSAQFGIDTRIEGMLYGAIRQNPVYGSKVIDVDDAAAKAMPGVFAVYSTDDWVAVLADNSWRAQRAADALRIRYEEGENAEWSSAALASAQAARVDEEGHAAEAIGDAKSAIASAAVVREAVYAAPFLAHATMEPMNCTAHVETRRARVWAPNQAVDFVLGMTQQLTGLPPEVITIETPYLGGGFGRRFVIDYVAQAVTLSRVFERPVKLTWSREEDIQHDHYRPMQTVKMRAAIGEDGLPLAVRATAVGDGPIRRLFAQAMEDPNVDRSVVEGLIGQPYAIEHHRVDVVYDAIPAPIGFWRSVGHSINAFVYESFVDELAGEAGIDPLDYRRRLLAEKPAHLATLDKAAELAGYRPDVYEIDGTRRAMGVALHESFGSIVAEIAEVSIDRGETRAHAVWAAIDVGSVVNPAIVEAQVESAIAYGLSAALYEEVAMENGRAQAGNFDSYPILGPERMPNVTVAVLTSGRPMGGVGEPGAPPVAPAVVNALAKLTGKRIRALPLAKQDLAAA